MTREGAWELLREYNKDEFHLEHAEIVGKTMRQISGRLWVFYMTLILRCTHRSTALRVRRLCVSAA